jgi:hypothetical protein
MSSAICSRDMVLRTLPYSECMVQSVVTEFECREVNKRSKHRPQNGCQKSKDS